MKSLSTLLLAFGLATGASAQVIFSSDLSSWSGGTPSDFTGTKTSIENDSIVEVNSGAMYGTSTANIINTESSHKRLASSVQSIIMDSTYEVEIWVKGNGSVRAGMFDGALSAGAFGYQYGSYVSINGSTNTSFVQSFQADTTTNAAEFLISVKSTTGGNIEIDSMVVRMGTFSPPSALSIYDIQYTTDPSGDSPYSGQTVITGGVVTAIGFSGYYIQDNPGEWNGIYVFDSNNVAIGDSITFSAEVVEYFNFTELKNLTDFNIVSSQNFFMTDFITSTEVNSEGYEGVLVTVNGAQCTDDNTGANFGMWTINDGSGACLVDDVMYAYAPTNGIAYDVSGVVEYSYQEFKILPRDANDVSVSQSIGEFGMNSTYNLISKELIVITKVPTSVSIYGISGQKVIQTQNSTNHRIELNNISNGAYIITVTDGVTTKTRKVIVE